MSTTPSVIWDDQPKPPPASATAPPKVQWDDEQPKPTVSYAKPGPYKTALPPDQEQGFQSWVKQNKVPWQDTPNADYDMRGYYKAMQSGDQNAQQKQSQFDGKMHFPDTYKTPYHKTFSSESMYATSDAPHWEGDRLIDKSGKAIADETPPPTQPIKPAPIQVTRPSPAPSAPAFKMPNQGTPVETMDSKPSDLMIDPISGFPKGKVAAAMGKADAVAQGKARYDNDELEIIRKHAEFERMRLHHLETANKVLVEPFEKMAQKGAEAGRSVAEYNLVNPPTGDPTLARMQYGKGNAPVMAAQVQEKLKGLPAPIVGTARAVGATVGGVAADPRMWPLFFAGPEAGAAKTAMSAGFATQMAVGAYQQAGELGRIMDNPDVPQEDKWEAGANFVISTVMAGMSAGHPINDAVRARLKEFNSLPAADQQGIRNKLREKVPEVAEAVDKAAGAQQAPEKAPQVTWDDEKPQAKQAKPGKAAATKLEQGQGFNKRLYQQVQLENGDSYIFNPKKTNADAVREAAGNGTLWKLTGEKAPAEATEQAKADVRGEESVAAKPEQAPAVQWDDEKSESIQEPQAPSPKPVQASQGEEAPVVPQESQTSANGNNAVIRLPAEGNKITGETTPVNVEPQHSTEQPERRTAEHRVSVERKNIDEMSDEEKKREIEELRQERRSSELTGLPNKKAFYEDSVKMSESHQHVGFADVDDFKPFNTILGEDNVDARVLPVIGEAFARAATKEPGGSIKVYHRSGDEFWFRAEDKAAIARVVDRVNAALKDAVFTAEAPDGTIHEKRGAGLSHGTGRDTKSAEHNAKYGTHAGSKPSRKAAGQRSGSRDLPGRVGEEPAAGQQVGKRDVAAQPERPTEEVKPAKSAAERFTESHNAGKPEEAHKSIKDMVRERLGKKEQPVKVAETQKKEPARNAKESALQAGKAAFERGAKRVPALDVELSQILKGSGNKASKLLDSWLKGWDDANIGKPVPETPTEPFSLKTPPSDIGVKQYIDSLPKEQQDYASAAWRAIQDKGQAGLNEIDPEEHGVDADHVEHIDQKLLGISKKGEAAGVRAASERANVRRGNIQEPEAKPEGYGSKNTVFTADKRDAALARLKAKMGRHQTGIDPEMVNDLIDIGGYHFEAGLREFGDWAKKVVEDVGDWAKPYLKAIHEEIANTLASGGRIEQEQGHGNGQPTGREGRSEISGNGRESGHAPEHPSSEAVRGTEAERKTPEPSGIKRATGVEQREPVSRPGAAPEPGGRTESRSNPATERAAGRGRRQRPSGADGKPVEAESPHPPVRTIEEQHTRQDNSNYRYKDPSEVGKGGEMSKIDQNISAIRVLKELTEQGRHATPEEQEVLARYTGWGGLSGIFNRSYERQYRERFNDLTDLIDHEQLRGIQRSTINAHYTSPEVIDFMWKLADKMGFKGGRVIEPGMGVGYFFGLMPEEMRNHPDTRLLGVELDPITGRIAQELYQGAKILNTGYEKVQIPDNSLDFAVGNVPFADVKPFDPRYNKLSPRPGLHDYYFLKTLDKVRPGGIVSFITSRYTMDKVDSRIREMVADRADLVAAYRLPNTAFRGVAGTDVTADLLVLRKRAGDEAKGGAPFRDTVPHKEGIKINQYFQQHPENMFGEMTTGGTMYRGGEVTLEPKGELADHLKRALDNSPTEVYGHQAAEPDMPAAADPTERAPDNIKEGQFYLQDGAVKMKRQGVPVDLPKELVRPRTLQHIRSAIDLREKAAAVLQQMLADKDDEPLKPLQAALNKSYDSYLKKYGPTHGRELADNFGSDPDYGLLLALENLDKGSDGKAYQKADLFTKRTMRPWEPLTALPDEPESWLPASLSAKGKLDPEYIAQLAGKDAKDVIGTLENKNLIFRDPESNDFHTADEYLSGPVREKLETARAAAEVDSKFQKNVEALGKVQPEKVSIHDIQPKLGMSWIPGDVYESFIHDMSDSPEHQRHSYRGKSLTVRLTPGDNWSIEYGRDFNAVPLSNKFGTKDVSGAKILDDTLNLRQSNVYMKNAEGKPVLDKVATLSAREAQQRLKDAFTKWFHEKDDHHPVLEDKYNKTFNGTRLREFDGSHLTFPGMNPEWTPRSHQANAIWRTVVHGRALLAHAVGAGKTLEMISAGMEARRLGISRKNMYAVPNNMVGQWTRDFARIYPAARVLAAPEKGFQGSAERNEFMAKAATGDWDAVIVPHSVFDLVPVSDEYQEKTINQELEAARESLQAVQADDSMGQQQKKRTVKQMEKNILKYEARLEKLASGKKDNALRFDQLGVDTLFVDEAHRYKNLQVHTSLSNVSGVPTTASQRALDMLMKSQYMLDSHNGRGLVFATGTPITNTVAETYNMNRFVAPDILEKAGIRNFDQWRANFADEVTSWEYAPDGVTFRPVTSLSQYINTPELATMFRTFADVKTKEDLNLPVPKPNRKDITVRVTDEQNPLLQEIADRAEQLRLHPGDIDPKVDNWLKLSSDARKISLDPRLYRAGLSDHPDSKLNAAVRETKRIYDATKAEKGVQILFSDFFASHDLKTGTERFNALKEIKNKLIAEGVPEKEIAIVTDYSKGQMNQLQEDARNGKIRVLMGSTEKLGVGLNVQQRLKALHHLDQPWRPSDVEQREGRILRQGNTYSEVDIPRYISEPQSITSPKAFDLQMFQKLERKAKFIDQFMQGGMKARRMEEAAGRAMLTPQDFAIAKAQATGNPDAMKKIQLEHETNRLYMLNRDWESKRSNARYQARFADEQALSSKGQLADIQRIKGDYDAWAKMPEEERPVAVIDGKEFKNEKDNPASKQIQAYIAEKYPVSIMMPSGDFTINGVNIPVRVSEKNGIVGGKIERVPIAQYQLGNWHDVDSSSTLFLSAASRLRNLEKTIGALKDEIGSNTQHADSYRQQLAEKSPFQDKLEEAEKALMETNKRLGIGVDKIEEQIGDTQAEEPEPEETEGETDRSGERGSSTPAAMPIPALISSAAGVIKKGSDLYHGTVDKLLDWAHMGQTRPEIRKFDSDAADLATKMDAGGQYHKAVAEMIGKKVTGPLAETFDKADNYASRQKKNEISRDRMKGFHFLADAQNREWLEENHPEDFHRWSADPKIKEALEAYKPFEGQLRDAVKQLGGMTIDEDYIKRIMDFATSGVAYEGKTLKPGAEGPEPILQGQEPGSRGGGRDNVVSPQLDRSKARKDQGKFYWDHGVFDFGPSFEKRWVEVQSKLDEHRLAVHSMSMGTRIAPDEAMPEKVFYNGQEFYRPDLAKEIREVQKRGVSSESKALAAALGVSELPTPKDVREYGTYEPLRRGSRFETAARNLAANVLAGKEGLEAQAANVNRMAKLRYALPKEIVEALNDAGREKELGALSKKISQVLGPLTQFIRQQIVGLAYGVPHMANILRKVVQATPGAALNPVSWVNAFKVAFSKELKARSISGVEDPTYDMLLRNAAVSEGAVPVYKRYIEGNFDQDNWSQTFGNAFRKGGKEGAKVTPLSAAAGAGRLAIEPLNRFSEAGHRNLFKPGGIDQRARLWLGDFLKDRYPGMGEQRIAHEVNQTLGRYNRASWTDVQRNLGPFMLFPGWDYSSITFALKHPFKTAIAPAILMLLANSAVHAIGGNKKDESKDLERIHIGKYSVRTNLLNDNMGSRIWGWALRGGTAALQGKRRRDVTGEMVKGIPGDVAGVSTGTLNPLVSTPIQLGANRLAPGRQQEIVQRGDLGKKGKVLPNKAAEDYVDFGARRLFPLYDRATQAGNRPSLASFAGTVGVNINEKKKKKH
jgi:N12 class adenine-specific DNA methylase/GGDEF domain-containing protein